MKNRSISATAVAILTLIGAAASTAQVVPPARRTTVLDGAQQLLATKESNLPAKLTNPFHPEGFGQTEDTSIQDNTGNVPVEPPVRTGPRNDRELVAAIAGAIKPSGYFVLGGQPTLVFGQKRVKAGEQLTINFEGADYTLTITAIDRTSFTLRLNREEYTRPIK